MSSVYFLVDPNTGTRHPLGHETHIGRTQGEILLPSDIRVSSKHCKISVTPQSLTIEDLKSSNGTFVNGARLAPHQPMTLEPGAKISMGGTVFELVGDETPSGASHQMGLPNPQRPPFVRPSKNNFPIAQFLGIVLIFGAGGLGYSAWKKKGSAPQKAPSTIAEAATQPTTIDLYMQTSSEEFDRLTTTYAKLIDAVNVDGADKEAAIIEIKTGLEPLCRRLLEETRKIKPATESDRIYINLHQKTLFAMHQHMTTMTSFWENGDKMLEKEANKSLTEYLEASRQMRIYLENR